MQRSFLVARLDSLHLEGWPKMGKSTANNALGGLKHHVMEMISPGVEEVIVRWAAKQFRRGHTHTVAGVVRSVGDQRPQFTLRLMAFYQSWVESMALLKAFGKEFRHRATDESRQQEKGNQQDPPEHIADVSSQ
jgi:hypothetical protein